MFSLHLCLSEMTHSWLTFCSLLPCRDYIECHECACQSCLNETALNLLNTLVNPLILGWKCIFSASNPGCVSVCQCFFSKPSVYNSGQLFLLWRYGFYERLWMLQKTFDSNFAGSTYHILIVWERLRKKLHHILFVWHFQALMLLVGCFGLFCFIQACQSCSCSTKAERNPQD